MKNRQLGRMPQKPTGAMGQKTSYAGFAVSSSDKGAAARISVQGALDPEVVSSFESRLLD